jgi:segregation and condensation protein B
MELTSEMQNEVDNAEEIKNLKKVEAALFISGRFLSLQELITLTDINPILLRELIEKLIEKYDENSAIEILKQEGERWKMDVRPEHRNIVNRLATGTAEFSKAEQETLAIIAYKQPVKQSVIIKIRGNKAYEHVNHFIDIGLVRGKRIGHTKELNLSEDFYDYFSLGKKDAEEKEAEGKIEKQEIEEEQKMEIAEEKTNP